MGLWTCRVGEVRFVNLFFILVYRYRQVDGRRMARGFSIFPLPFISPGGTAFLLSTLFTCLQFKRRVNVFCRGRGASELRSPAPTPPAPPTPARFHAAWGMRRGGVPHFYCSHCSHCSHCLHRHAFPRHDMPVGVDRGRPAIDLGRPACDWAGDMTGIMGAGYVSGRNVVVFVGRLRFFETCGSTQGRPLR